MGIFHTFIRIIGVVRKELIELANQPGLVTMLVVGPLIILLLFGAGVSTRDPAVRTIFVAPPDEPALIEIVNNYAETQAKRLNIVEVSTDRANAMAGLEDGRADMVIVVPPNPRKAMEENRRVTMEVFHTFLDPIEQQAILLFARGATNDLNTILLTQLIKDTQSQADILVGSVDEYRNILTTAGLINPDTDLSTLDRVSNDVKTFTLIQPSIVAAPLRQETTSIAGEISTPVFYAPAVLALILQHLTMTFIALSIVREQELGTTELFAVSPLRSWERSFGKILAYFLAGGAISALLLGGIVFGLGAPVRGGVAPLALIISLELLASMGIGFVVGQACRNITQVVQTSMLVLLASVFFGGLVLSEERFQPWLVPVGWVLPMRHALISMRDSMLKGFAPDPNVIAALAIIGVVLIGIGMVWSGHKNIKTDRA
ncbi:ABC transporter permease [Stomatohabitans albus]|uniref:ABC transporter permease n=1 Tax=Stomatohabitans albus TaxID=3110766 RepID=UPI00300D7623